MGGKYSKRWGNFTFLRKSLDIKNLLHYNSGSNSKAVIAQLARAADL